MDPIQAEVLASQKHGLAFSEMRDGTRKQALVVYDRDGKELLRVTYDDAAKALLAAYGPSKPAA